MNEGEISNNSMPNAVGNSSNTNEYEQPAAIVSAGADGETAASPVSTNPFGFHAGSRRTDHAKNNNFAASQSVAPISPNAPKFFNDALMANAPAPEAPKASKKPFIIGAIAFVVVALVVVVILTVSGRITGGNGAKLSEVQEVIAQYADDISFFETRIDDIFSLSHEQFSLDGFIYDGEKSYQEIRDDIQKKTESVNKLYENIQKYSAIEKGDYGDLNPTEDLQNLKRTLKDRKVLYEKYANTMFAIADVANGISDKSVESSISAITENVSALEAARTIDVQLANGKSIIAKMKAQNCSLKKPTPACNETNILYAGYINAISDDRSAYAIFKSIFSDKGKAEDKPSKYINNIMAIELAGGEGEK